MRPSGGFRIFRTMLLALLWCAAGTVVSAQTATGTPPDPTQVREDLKSILENGEFHASTPQEPSQFTKIIESLQKWWRDLRKLLEKLFPSASGVGMGQSVGVQWVFIVLFLTVGGWLLYRLLSNALKSRRKKRAVTRTAFDLDDTEEEIAKEPDAWLAESEKWLREGDYRRAYRALFLAMLLLLDRAGIVAYERSRTNGEYLRSLRRAHQNALYEFLNPLVLEFELRWYSDKPTDAEDTANLRREYDYLQTLLATDTAEKIAPEPPLAAEGA